MRSRANTLACTALLACLMGLGSLHAAPARAAEEAVAAATEAKAPVIDRDKLSKLRRAMAIRYPMASRVSRYLSRAVELADEEGPEEALALLDRLNFKRLNPFERASAYRVMAGIVYATGDYAATIGHFESALAEEVFPLETDDKLRYNIAQLYAGVQQWPDVIKALDRWFLYIDEPVAAAYYLLALSRFQLGEIDAAITDAEKAIDLEPEPPEGWLQLLAALHVQKEDYANAAPVLEELVVRFHKKQYWVQLSLIYGARDNFRGSLAVQQVAYLQGFLSEDKEIRRLARSYLYHDLPYPAANALQKGLEDGVIEEDADFFELLANSWIASREYERSLPPLEKAAALSEDGNLYVRLGQVHLQREEWPKAIEYLQLALSKGDLKDAGNAQLLRGIALYNDQRVEQARSSFVQAREYESTRKTAEGWIDHIAKEAQAS